MVRFEREDDEGPVEYKLSLATADLERIRHLITQLLFRLNEGNGRALYRIGVRDDGYAQGLAEPELEASLRTLRSMASQLGASIRRCELTAGEQSKRIAEVALEKKGSSFVSPLSSRQRRRVAVIGAEGAGKSTLIGLLATGSFDDGRGLARAAVLRHGHELEDGQTSDIRELTMRADPSVALIDLAGSEKYLKTTIFGLTARAPDAALLVADIGDRRLRRMTLEHLGVAVALQLPVLIALTHADTCSGEQRALAVAKLEALYAKAARSSRKVEEPLRVFVVSSVTGEGYAALTAALSRRQGHAPSLPPPTHKKRRPHPSSASSSEHPSSSEEEEEEVLVRIHDAHRSRRAGTVVAGTVHRGSLRAGDVALFGPFGSPSLWRRVRVRSIRLAPDDEPAAVCGIGQSAAFALGDDCRSVETVRRSGRAYFFCGVSPQKSFPERRRATGMVLVSAARPPPRATSLFTADLLVLCAPRRRGLGRDYESVVHAHAVRQSAKILHVDSLDKDLVAGQRAVCTLKFLFFPEYIAEGTTIILRDGRTRAVGTVLACLDSSSSSSSFRTEETADVVM